MVRAKGSVQTDIKIPKLNEKIGLSFQPVGTWVLAVAVGRAAGQDQRQGIFAGGRKPASGNLCGGQKEAPAGWPLTVSSAISPPGQGQQRRGGLQPAAGRQCGAVGLVR